MLTPDGGVVVVVGGSAWASVARRGSREQDADKTRLALPLPLFLKCFHSTHYLLISFCYIHITASVYILEYGKEDER